MVPASTHRSSHWLPNLIRRQRDERTRHIGRVLRKYERKSKVTFSYSSPPIVVDASVSIELLPGDAAWGDRFEEWVTDDRMLLAPGLFVSEVADGMLRGHRVLRGHGLPPPQPPLGSIASSGLGIEIADRGQAGVRDAVALARENGLTVYHALYLQLTLDVEGELATLDRDLRRTAKTQGVQVA